MFVYLKEFQSITELLAHVAAVHVVPLQPVCREEINQAVKQGNIRRGEMSEKFLLKNMEKLYYQTFPTYRSSHSFLAGFVMTEKTFQLRLEGNFFFIFFSY